jgi:SEC-C motif
MARDTCKCGSGLPFARCHGDPRNEFARVQALREAEGIAVFFPTVRLQGPEVEGFVEETAAAFPDSEDLPVEEGLALIRPEELGRLVDSWARPYADRWLSLTTAAGDVGAAERTLALGALRVAVYERQPTPHELLEPLDDGAMHRSPLAALTLVLPPEFVWSADEARAARAAADGRRKARQRSDAVEQVAYALVSWDHVRRLRALSMRLSVELPSCGLPTTARVLGDACSRVARSEDDARAAVAGLLIAYAERLGAAPVVTSH